MFKLILKITYLKARHTLFIVPVDNYKGTNKNTLKTP